MCLFVQNERQEDVVDDRQTADVGETKSRRYELEVETLQWHVEAPVGLEGEMQGDTKRCKEISILLKWFRACK